MTEFMILAAVMIGIMMFAYSAGKNKITKEIQEEALDDVERAKQIRLDLLPPSDVDELLHKYQDR